MNGKNKAAVVALGIALYLIAGGPGGMGNAQAAQEPPPSTPVIGDASPPPPSAAAPVPAPALSSTTVSAPGNSGQVPGSPSGSGQALGNPAGASTPAAGQGQFEVSVTNGLLTVRLKDADLFEVMKVLSEKTGMRVKVDRGASKKITLTFRDLPFEKGIRNLIRPLNNAMIWKKGKDDHGMDVDILEELHVFREGHQGGETVDYAPEENQPVDEKSTVTKGGWSEETRSRMLEKLTVKPSVP